MAAAPLYTGTLNGKPLRFFASPRDGADLPWHCFTDLMGCCGVADDQGFEFLAGFRGRFTAHCKTVTMEGGVLAIAPHWSAAEFVSVMAAAGRVAPETVGDYARNCAEAAKCAMGGMDLKARMAWFVSAACRDGEPH